MPAILVIDDDPSIRVYCRVILETAGHLVREAVDGSQGILAFRQEPADLVLCDVYMPEKDGLEVLQELRRDFPGIRVVIMSGGNPKTRRDDLEDALKLGAHAALRKPISPSDLLATVATALQ